MGMTIHWNFQGPPRKADAQVVIEKMRQRAMDLPFESVGEIVHFKGPQAQYDRDQIGEPYRWLKIQARGVLWSDDGDMGWEFPPKEIIGFEVVVAPGCERMELFLASYPKTMIVKDENTGRSNRIRTNYSSWSGGGFCKTQYSSHPAQGGNANFLRAHLSVCRMLDYAGELGIAGKVTDESGFFENRDIPALIQELGDWNAMIAAGVGAFGDLLGGSLEAPIKTFPDYEHLEAKGATKIDAWLQKLKEEQKKD